MFHVIVVNLRFRSGQVDQMFNPGSCMFEELLKALLLTKKGFEEVNRHKPIAIGVSTEQE